MIADNLQTLFAGGHSAHFTEVRFRVLRRHGEPFFYLPCEPRLAAAAMPLYGPQRGGARLLQRLLQVSLRAGLPLPLETVSVSIREDSPLLGYLTNVAGGQRPATMAILAGNPRAAGQRFVILIFNSEGQPQWVVKAGSTPAARALLSDEIAVLEGIPAGLPGPPRLHGEPLIGETSAFALPFVEGTSPRATIDRPQPARLLAAWIDRERTVALTDLVVWQKLHVSSAPALSSFDSQPLHPALFHGDFAPWNVKVSGDRWQVLDWERGQLSGPPAWDWFHYVVFPAVLVEKSSAAIIRGKLSQLIASAAFAEYAALAGIVGRERMLARLFLLYCAEVLRPTEGLPIFRELAYGDSLI